MGEKTRRRQRERTHITLPAVSQTQTTPSIASSCHSSQLNRPSAPNVASQSMLLKRDLLEDTNSISNVLNATCVTRCWRVQTWLNMKARFTANNAMDVNMDLKDTALVEVQEL